MTMLAGVRGMHDEGGAEAVPRSWFASLAGAGIWGTLAGLGLWRWWAHPAVIEGGVTMFNLIVAILFVIRHKASLGGSRLHAAIAWLTTFLPIVGLAESGRGVQWAGLVVEGLGITGLIVSALNLGRCFGIAPADRGVMTRGLYSLVRHPMYTSGLLAVLGYCLAFPAAGNWMVLGALAVGQVARAMWEEQLLGRSPAYRAYAARVRFRLVPCLW